MNEEMIAKLQKAKTVEEIIAIAKEYGKEVTAEKAQELLDKLSGAAGELSDSALAAVAGGGYYRQRQGMVRKPFRQVKCRSTKRGVSGLFTPRFSFYCTNGRFDPENSSPDMEFLKKYQNSIKKF